MKYLNHQSPLQSRLLLGENDHILKEVEDHKVQNIMNTVFVVYQLIPTLLIHPKVQ